MLISIFFVNQIKNRPQNFYFDNQNQNVSKNVIDIFSVISY